MRAARALAVIAVIGLLAVGAWYWIGGGAGTTGVGPVTPGSGGVPGVPGVPDGPDGSDQPLPRTMITLIPGIDDRLHPEPCHKFGVGGLYSVTALLDEMREYARTVGVSMGDVTRARGAVGQEHLAALYELIIPHTGIMVICPGEGELGAGAAFLRSTLTEAARRHEFEILGANVTDAAGKRLLRGWRIVQVKNNPPAPQTPRNILFVSVVAYSMQKRLDARGSDITLQPAGESIEAALREAAAEARESGFRLDNRVLLVQGTTEEAAALVSADMQFDFVVSARGGVLPQREPTIVHDAPIYFGGRGVRFAWRVILDDAPGVAAPGNGAPQKVRGFLVRLGQSLFSKGSPMQEALPPVRDALLPAAMKRILAKNARFVDPRGRYVGSSSCSECHPEISAAHGASAHARRVPQLPQMMSCTKCHATGFDAAGGWSGPSDTTDLGSISCEACHGPAEQHIADTTQPYGAFRLDNCTQCHLPDHSPEFDPEKLWKDFGHKLGTREK